MKIKDIIIRIEKKYNYNNGSFDKQADKIIIKNRIENLKIKQKVLEELLQKIEEC